MQATEILRWTLVSMRLSRRVLTASRVLRCAPVPSSTTREGERGRAKACRAQPRPTDLAGRASRDARDRECARGVRYLFGCPHSARRLVSWLSIPGAGAQAGVRYARCCMDRQCGPGFACWVLASGNTHPRPGSLCNVTSQDVDGDSGSRVH